MVMLTYIARSGQELPLAGESDCAAAIRTGDLHRGSLVMDGRTGRWMKAGEHGELAGLLASVRVTGPIRPGSDALKAVTVTAWLVALIGPPAVASAFGADPFRVLQLSWVYMVALAVVGAAVGFYVKSRRGRWGLALLVAILALAVGLGAIAKSTGALHSGLMPMVTGLFADRAK